MQLTTMFLAVRGACNEIGRTYRNRMALAKFEAPPIKTVV